MQASVEAQLKTLNEKIREHGISVSKTNLSWNAVNQTTKTSSAVTLPALQLGDEALGQEASPDQKVEIVDDIREASGAAATIFQRMNNNNDMLRVATSVIGADGKRAIGTYIPAVGADGKDNPVVASVMAGKTFRGVATVVDKPYVVSYDPLRDASGQIIGMTFAGLPQSGLGTMQKMIQSIRIGKTGHATVLGTGGDARGLVVISGGGEAEKTNMLEASDINGTRYVDEMLKKALTLSAEQTSTVRYTYESKNDKKHIAMIANVAYYQPWNWAIITETPQIAS